MEACLYSHGCILSLILGQAMMILLADTVFNGNSCHRYIFRQLGTNRAVLVAIW